MEAMKMEKPRAQAVRGTGKYKALRAPKAGNSLAVNQVIVEFE
jgi:hypothetical protein